MQRADVINAIARGEEPYAKNGSFILRTLGTGGYTGRTLVGPGGPTSLGQLWAETTGRQLPERGFRMDQPTIHHGASEFIKDLRGKEHQVRKWTGRAYTYTRLGRTYFDANKAKIIVEIPVLIEGRRGAGRDHRRDGEAYERRAYMPVSHFGVGEVQLSERLTSAQKESNNWS